MKRSMYAAAAILSVLSGSALVAQPPGGEGNGQPDATRVTSSDPRVQAAMDRAQVAAEKLISVDFAGGTIGQYVEAVRKASPGRTANVIVSERASKIPISAINLKDVSVGVAVFAISAAYSGPHGDWRINPVFPSGMPMRALDSAMATYRVDFEPTLEVDLGDLIVESFSLGKLLNPTGIAKPDTDSSVVLTAIDTGLRMLIGNADRKPELKFHPDSSLLFVRGAKSEVKLVGSVVARMTEEAERRQVITERRLRADQLRNLEVKDAKLRVELRELELSAVQSQLEERQELVERGTAPALDLVHLRLEFGRARMNLERSKLDLERAQLVNPEIGSAQPASGDDGEDAAPPAGKPEDPKTPKPAGTKRPNR